MELVKRLLFITVLFCGVWFTLASAKANKDKKNERNWCCSVETKHTEEVTVTESKLIMKNITRKSIIGYQQCENEFVPGFYDCPIYKEFNSQVPRYVIQQVTKQVQLNTPCPKEHLYCCEGFTLVNGQCLTKDDADLSELLGDLGSLG